MKTVKEFKKFHTRLRLIRNCQYVGTHGHYSDLVKEFNVTMSLIRNLNDMSKKTPKLIYGRFTNEYQENESHVAYWESYGEKTVNA